MKTVFSTIRTPQGCETVPVPVPNFATPRSIIRRCKIAHSIDTRHDARELLGPDGSTYIHLRLYGSAATITIDIDAMEDEQ
jgi:hypothetical protein